ncbi:MAG: TolC family protein [bacterium]|nr:TolC family protein [bacterium]
MRNEIEYGKRVRFLAGLCGLLVVCGSARAQTSPPDDDDVVLTDERLRWHLPDPDRALEVHASLKAAAGASGAESAFHSHVIELIDPVHREARMRLCLSETLHRALANNFAIRVESYNPAIDTTRVVEAEAAFDATFFLDISNAKQNVPTTSVLQGTNAQAFDIKGGIRQLLPTGMQMSTSFSTNRTWQQVDERFQSINPAYFSQFVVEFRQPLLRGFGLGFNRSQINISKNNRRISDEAFRRKVRDTLLDVETAYWRLAQSRRLVPISARLIAGYQRIYEDLWQRREFDVLPIQINETKARLEAARSDHVRVLNEVRNAEDILIALMNDPLVDLADDMELIPTDVDDARNPLTLPREQVILDRVAEVQAALDHREEIREARWRIGNARLLVGVAKNDALPRFDLVFQYAVDGLGKSADRSFDEVTKNDFHEYFVGVELELPVGNRARRAAERRARLQHAQSIAALEQLFEQVILDVNMAVRQVNTLFDVIRPNLVSLEASEDRLESIIIRAERKDFTQLSMELDAHRGLAAARQALLESLASYNVAIIEVEKAKGTLLEYNSVSLAGQLEE